MALNSNGQGTVDEQDEQELPTAHLTRPSPDAILADEADENALLGNESESEASDSRRNSRIAPAKEDYRTSQSDLPETPEAYKSSVSTPTQNRVVSSKRSSLKAPLAYKTGPNEADLKAQIADLTNQVTGLNSKLVNSFMRISDMEDDLSDKHEKLTWHQSRIASLEKEREEHLAALNTGLLVEKAHVSNEMQKMMERVIEETAERGKAISDKEKIEAELDELSSSLFSEANKMVAVERLARARAEEKSKSMEERLRDTEEIMEQQQKRLVELQSVVEKGDQAKSEEQGNRAKADGETNGQDSKTKGDAVPSILPFPQEEQLRLDVTPYTELRAFLNHLRRLRLQLAPFYNYPLPGASSNANSTLPSPTISRTNSPAPHQGRVVSAGQSNLSPNHNSITTTLSPFSVAGVSRHKDYPSLPSNVEQLINLNSQISSINLLKRIHEEDCEPCLRLDVAPALNWLSRRQMQTSILDGNLLIEPVFGGGVYDETEVRNRSQGSPPAACALCGKAVLNVPLPGGGTAESGNWMSAAGTAASNLQASVSNSLPLRDQSSSPPLSSASFFGSSTNSIAQSGNLQQKKSSTGLFSTLRSMGGGSPRPSLSPNPSSSNFAGQSHSEGSHVGVEEDLFAHRLAPIPTHIFRIGETSSSRYLLCPNHCLQRLRAICEFWGYIRNLERAVVLEGKLAWDEETIDKSVGSAPNLPERKSASIKEVKSEEFTATKDEAEGVKVESNDNEKKEGEEIDVHESNKDEAEENKNLVDSMEKNSEDGHSITNSRRLSHTGSTSDEEDGFADAQSIASLPEDGHATHTEEEEEVDGPVEEKEKNGLSAATPTETNHPLPPPPPRSKTRRPVPVPPRLPPRRSFRGQSPASSGPEPRRLLPAKGDSTLTWEEKVYLEIVRHRADMWSARVGLQKQS